MSVIFFRGRNKVGVAALVKADFRRDAAERRDFQAPAFPGLFFD